VGDSTGMAYVEAIRTVAAMGADWRVVSAAAFGCTFVDIAVPNSDQSTFNGCPAMKARAVETINELRPDLVLVTNTYEPRRDAATGEFVTLDEWRTGVTRMVDQFRDNVGTVALLSPPPSGAQIGECYTPISSPSDCVTKIEQRWNDMAATERLTAANFDGVFIDSRKLFCAAGSCPAFVGETPMKLDLVHITGDYARKMAPALREIFTESGVM